MLATIGLVYCYRSALPFAAVVNIIYTGIRRVTKAVWRAPSTPSMHPHTIGPDFMSYACCLRAPVSKLMGP